jgi:crossover junction endodeoxyribonuclease RusA
MQIELPFPAKILWPNGRGHHMAKHRAFQAHKGWAWAAATAELGPGYRYTGERVQWSATFYPKTRNEIDEDNAAAALKAYQDGLAKALGVNDRIFARPAIHFGEPVKGGKVVVTIDG